MAKQRLSKLQKAILLIIWRAQNQVFVTPKDKEEKLFSLFKMPRAYSNVYIVNVISRDFYGQEGSVSVDASVAISRSIRNLEKKELIRFITWGYLRHIRLTEKGEGVAKKLAKDNPPRQ